METQISKRLELFLGSAVLMISLSVFILSPWPDDKLFQDQRELAQQALSYVRT